MAYNQVYFQNKKDELDKKFNRSKDQVIQDMIVLLNRFGENQKDLQQRYAELIKTEEESKKASEVDKTEKKKV
jgi:hypothetical protein